MPRISHFALVFSLLGLVSAPGCSSKSSDATSATVSFDPDANYAGTDAVTGETSFIDFPYPSDLRLTADGNPDVSAFPDPGVSILPDLKKGAAARHGFPMVPVAYFKLTAQPTVRDPNNVIDGGTNAPIFLIDVDPASPERGTTFPVVAQTLPVDPYTPTHTLAVAARPGIVLAPNRKYAFVIRHDVGLEGGGDLASPSMLAQLAHGDTPATSKGGQLRDLYAPLWDTLDKVNVPRTDVSGATVFTTGDVVADNEALGNKVLAAFQPELTDLTLEPDPTNAQPYLCHVRAKINLPQFQKGTPIYNTDGLFEFDANGLPIKQRDEEVPVSISIPKLPMPAGGFPLVIYFHGSGGVSRQVIDGGDQGDVPGDHWPAGILAQQGFGAAGQALPISPERVPGAAETDYLNIQNLIAMRDTFRQGILESRLFLAALGRVQIPPSVIAACMGPSLPAGETAYHFAPSPHSQGQSMGGMYTNLVSASEKNIKLAVPTGAGGYWVYFILKTSTVPGAAGFVSLILQANQVLTFLHPALHIIETALEPIDPMVSAARLAHRPLPGHTPRPIYEPVGINDSYFPTEIYDAMALAYHHPRVGNEVWPTMATAQALEGIDTPLTYPVKMDLKSVDGVPYTGAILQYAPAGMNDGHAIYRQLEDVYYQYGCFHASFLKTGTAVIGAPQALGSACAQ